MKLAKMKDGNLFVVVTDEYKTQWELEHPVEIPGNFEE